MFEHVLFQLCQLTYFYSLVGASGMQEQGGKRGETENGIDRIDYVTNMLEYRSSGGTSRLPPSMFKVAPCFPPSSRPFEMAKHKTKIKTHKFTSTQSEWLKQFITKYLAVEDSDPDDATGAITTFIEETYKELAVKYEMGNDDKKDLIQVVWFSIFMLLQLRKLMAC